MVLPHCWSQLPTWRQYTCMQTHPGETNVYYANARNCRVMPLACSTNKSSVGSRQVVSLSLSLSHTHTHIYIHTHTHHVWGFRSCGLEMPEFFPERIVLQDKGISEAVSRRLPTAQSEVQHFELMKQTTVPNVLCGAATHFVWLRAQASVWFRTHYSKDTVQCMTCNGIIQLLRSAHTVCPHVVYRMAVKTGDCPHNSLNTGCHNAKWVYYEVPT